MVLNKFIFYLQITADLTFITVARGIFDEVKKIVNIFPMYIL